MYHLLVLEIWCRWSQGPPNVRNINIYQQSCNGSSLNIPFIYFNWYHSFARYPFLGINYYYSYEANFSCLLFFCCHTQIQKETFKQLSEQDATYHIHVHMMTIQML